MQLRTFLWNDKLIKADDLKSEMYQLKDVSRTREIKNQIQQILFTNFSKTTQIVQKDS